MARKVKLNHAGIAEVLKSAEMRTAVDNLAERIAEHVREQNIMVGAFKGGSGKIPLPVEVVRQATDRARASVRLRHPAGLAVQAKRGALTRAAAEAGIKVKPRKG